MVTCFIPKGHLLIALHAIICQIHIDQKRCHLYLQSFDDTYLALTFLFHLILTCMSWLQPRKEDMHFILSDNDNYYFDVKVRCCGFLGFVNDVIDCGCLGYVLLLLLLLLLFRIKEKEKDTF